jgi:hypothetical protein
MSLARTDTDGKTTYSIRLNTGLDLRALLTTARERGLPVAMERETHSGMVTQHIGVVTGMGADRLHLRTADGGTVDVALWDVDRAALIDEGTVAA